MKKEDRKKREGSQILGWMYARGEGHSDAYCVQQGFGGGGVVFFFINTWKKMCM